MLGLDYGIPGTNDQGRSDPRYAGMPEFRTGFQALGNSPRGLPLIATRGPHRSAATSRRSRPTTTSDSGIVSTTCTWTTGSRNGRTRAGGSTSPPTPRARSAPAPRRELLQPVRGIPAWPRGHRAQELSVRAVHRPRMAACHVRARPLDGESEDHAGSRRAMGVLPDHEPRRSSDRDDGPRHARRPDWRGRRQPEEHGPGGAEGLIRAEARWRLSPQRRDGVPQRLWRHARRERDVGAGSVSRRLQLPARAERVVPAGRRYEHLRLVWNAQSGHPAPRGTGSEHGSHAPAERLRDADGGAGIDAPRAHALLERGGRAAYSVQRVGRRGVCRQQAGRRPAARGNADDQHQQRPAPRRRRHGSAVLPIVRTSGRHRDLLAMAQDELSRAADRRDAAVHAGVDAEGPLHVEPVESAASRLRGAGSGNPGPQLGARQRRPAARVTDGVHLSAAVAQ